MHDTQCLFHPTRIEESIASKIPQQVFDDSQDMDPPEQGLLADLYSKNPDFIANIFKEPHKKHKAFEFVDSSP